MTSIWDWLLKYYNFNSSNRKVLWPHVLIVFYGYFNTLNIKVYVTCHKISVVYDIKIVFVFKGATNF